MPGGVEAHAHFSVPFYGTVSCDNYETGTRAAAFGGVTTVIDFATQEKGQSLLDTVRQRKAMAAGQPYVDYAFHVIVTDLNPEILAEIPRLVQAGIPSIKVYTVYKKEGLMLGDGQIYQLLRAARECGALISVHAENPDLVDLLTTELLAQNKVGAWEHYLSRPEFVAAEAGKRVIHWAKQLQAPLYIVHVSDQETMDAIKHARDEGFAIYAEVCPHYLHFTNEVYKRPDGRRFICSPAIKGQASQDALWTAVRDGTASTIASDHCPFRAAEKDADVPFPMTPNGTMGLETRYAYTISEALKGRIGLSRAVELCATNPARIFGCAGKGSITIGYDADIAIVDPNTNYTVSQATSHSAADHTIWQGYECIGTMDTVISSGKIIVQQGQLLGSKGAGQWLHRTPFTPTSG